MIPIDEKFWILVQTTPDLSEAIDLLRRARQTLLIEKMLPEHQRDGRTDEHITQILMIINDERRRLNLLYDESNWRNAVKQLYGQAAFEACLNWVREARAREIHAGDEK